MSTREKMLDAPFAFSEEAAQLTQLISNLFAWVSMILWISMPVMLAMPLVADWSWIGALVWLIVLGFIGYLAKAASYSFRDQVIAADYKLKLISEGKTHREAHAIWEREYSWACIGPIP